MFAKYVDLLVLMELVFIAKILPNLKKEVKELIKGKLCALLIYLMQAN